MKRNAAYIAFFLVLAVVVVMAGARFFTGPGFRIARIMAAVKPVIPHTISLLESSTDSAGQTVMERTIRAVRADGAEVTMRLSLDPATGAVRMQDREMYFPDRLIARVMDTVSAKSTRRARLASFQLGFRDRSATPRQNAPRISPERPMRDLTGEAPGGVETVQASRIRPGKQEDAEIS